MPSTMTIVLRDSATLALLGSLTPLLPVVPRVNEYVCTKPGFERQVTEVHHACENGLDFDVTLLLGPERAAIV